MFGFGKKKKEEENIISDYDLLNNSNAEEVYDDFGNPKYLKDGEDPFLNGKDDGEDIPDEYLADDEEAVTE